MRNNIKMKLLFVFGALSILLAGCLNSSMGGMDHSKMGETKTEPKEGQTVTNTSKVTTLSGKEFTLTAQPSNLEVTSKIILPVWTFNNSVPGPEIRVKQGDNVKITLKNELPEPVTIHWHGVPVPNAMDGIPGITQNAVQSGKTFTYEFKVDVPGTYWYHSHQDSVNQVDKGLYGAFIVEANDDKADRDYTLVLDEWMSSGSTEMDMSTVDHSTMNMDSSNEKTDGEMNMNDGNKGNTVSSLTEGHDMSMYDLFTINGKSGDSIEKLTVKKGEKVRVRLINAGFKSHNIHLHGHDFKVTSTDGQPISSPQVIKDQLISIAPGERYDLEFEANNPGQWYLEEHGNESPVKEMKAIIQYDGSNVMKDIPNETVSLPTFDMTRYGLKGTSVFTLEQKYDVEFTMNLGTEQKEGKQMYTINRKTYPDTEMLKVKKGEKVKVRFVNNSKTDDHPMHLHGHFFQVLSKNGQPLEGSPVMKDTLNVKPGEEYVVAFEANNPGNWMFHCHDLHHASAGMVTHLLYTDFKTDFVSDPKAGNKME